VEEVSSIKLVGVHITNDLKWALHVDKICKKASQRIFMLVHLRRSGAKEEDLLTIYISIIRPILEYACPVWSCSLPNYLTKRLEHIQIRCLQIIFPGLPYNDALLKANIPSLERRS